MLINVDFFTTGVYDLRNRGFKKTISPSIDILVSSNLERFLYLMHLETLGSHERAAAATKGLYDSLRLLVPFLSPLSFTSVGLFPHSSVLIDD